MNVRKRDGVFVQVDKSAQPSPEDEAIAREAKERLWAEVAALPTRRMQIIIRARFVLGQTLEQVADMLGSTVSNIHADEQEALEILRGRLEALH